MSTRRPLGFLPEGARQTVKRAVWRAPRSWLAAPLVVTRNVGRKRKKPKRSGSLSRPQQKALSNVFAALGRRNLTDKDVYPDIEFLVYYGERRCQGHYRMWDPVFRSSGFGYGTIVRYSAPWYDFIPSENLFPVTAMNQIGPLIARMPNLKAIFYPANNGVNLQIIRNNELTHVFVGHGDSGKSSSANKVFRVYDEVWVAGDAHIERFESTPGNYSSINFRKVGQPWLRDFFERVKTVPEGINVGYFPTWKGYYADSDYSSITEIEWIAAALASYQPEHFSELISKPHPWTTKGQRQEMIRKTVELPWVQHLDPSGSLQDALTDRIKIAICDNSSSIVEALYLGVPILLYVSPKAVYPSDFEQQHEHCYLFSDEIQLQSHLEELFTLGRDPLAELRHRKFRQIIDVDAMEQDGFASELQRLAAQG